MNSNYHFDSCSTPNLARLRHSHNQSSSQKSVHLAPSQPHHQASSSSHGTSHHHTPVHENHISDDDPNNGGKMSRSERKRMWRKNLSADKLAKLRERDALRKRVERMNMSADKRRDLRTKDTARKAALRKERRMSESPGHASSSSLTAVDTCTNLDVHDGHAQVHLSIDDARRNGRNYGTPSESNGRHRHRRNNDQYSEEDQFNKIPVHSLLN